MNDKAAQKEFGGKQLANYDIFKNMNAGQIAYIMKNGSEGQKKSLASNFGGENSDFKAYMKDLHLKATDPNIPDAKAMEEFKKTKENVLAVYNNKP
jgi:CO dehydrogenase/acetyl-CoA synthase delta subunit